jgi:hypothetical protein
MLWQSSACIPIPLWSFWSRPPNFSAKPFVSLKNKRAQLLTPTSSSVKRKLGSDNRPKNLVQVLPILLLLGLIPLRKHLPLSLPLAPSPAYRTTLLLRVPVGLTPYLLSTQQRPLPPPPLPHLLAVLRHAFLCPPLPWLLNPSPLLPLIHLLGSPLHFPRKEREKLPRVGLSAGIKKRSVGVLIKIIL